jgi:ribosomal protein S18 acetylase RimI-like enzyme
MIRKRISFLDDRAIFELIRHELLPLNPPELQQGDHSDQMLLQRLKRGTTYVWAFSERTPAAAFITVIPAGAAIFVDLLAVHPMLRGSGIGTSLLHQAERYGWKKGCRRIQLYVNDSNPKGIRFYRKNGMSIVHYNKKLRSYLMDKPI